MEERITLKAPQGAKKKKKIVGRGASSGKGGKCGKGDKGQNSRSGGKVRPGFEGGQMPLYRRIARRGFSNYPFKKKYQVVNIGDLNSKFAEGETVNRDSLREKKLIKSKYFPVKILGDGDVEKKLIVAVEKISKSAAEKIKAQGGEIQESNREE
jgi:large subunit ribosomal protein L15